VVPTLDDALFELTETFVVNLTSPTNAILADAQGTAAIVSDDPKPSVSVGDASKVEGASGGSSLVFTVTLSAVSGAASKVSFATVNGTAVAGSDYTAKTGTLTIQAGKPSGTVSVTIRGDTILEPEERFTLILSAPSNVTVADGEAVGTIVNDD
jgi:chitinase